MEPRHISVTFHVDVQDDKPWFRLPKSIVELFGLKQETCLLSASVRLKGHRSSTVTWVQIPSGTPSDFQLR